MCECVCLSVCVNLCVILILCRCVYVHDFARTSDMKSFTGCFLRLHVTYLIYCAG